MTEETVDLTLKRVNQIVADLANLRDDMIVVTAMISRIERAVTTLVDEMRANHRQTARLIDRVRALEDA